VVCHSLPNPVSGDEKDPGPPAQSFSAQQAQAAQLGSGPQVGAAAGVEIYALDLDQADVASVAVRQAAGANGQFFVFPF